MAMTLTAQDQQPRPALERRAFQRMPLRIYGRFMLEDRTEHPCQVTEISPGNATLLTEQGATLGEKVIVYLEHLGRIEGVVTRVVDDGFAMTLIASDRKKEKLAAQLTWLANKNELGLPEDRRHERLAPRNPISVLQLGDGRQYQCRIIDLSISGAAVEIDVRPALGTKVMLGSMNGVVVRHFEEGIALEFAALQQRDTIDAALERRTSAA